MMKVNFWSNLFCTRNKHPFWDCIWDITHRDVNGNVVYFERKKNSFVNQGEEVALEVLLRNQDTIYLPDDAFYIGMYRGTISETTTLLTVPNEPVGNGYDRVTIARSTVGWPVKEQIDGDWRMTSLEVSYEADGGDIGPISGAFMCTSSDNTGRLICAVASSVERTILAGETMSLTMKVKCK